MESAFRTKTINLHWGENDKRKYKNCQNTSSIVWIQVYFPAISFPMAGYLSDVLGNKKFISQELNFFPRVSSKTLLLLQIVQSFLTFKMTYLHVLFAKPSKWHTCMYCLQRLKDIFSWCIGNLCLELLFRKWVKSLNGNGLLLMRNRARNSYCIN